MTPFFFSFFLWNTKLYLDILRERGGGLSVKNIVLFCIAMLSFLYLFFCLFVCLFVLHIKKDSELFEPQCSTKYLFHRRQS